MLENNERPLYVKFTLKGAQNGLKNGLRHKKRSLFKPKHAVLVGDFGKDKNLLKKGKNGSIKV